MLGKLHDYSTAINAKAEPFPSEPVLMALVIEQHKLTRRLKSKFNSGTSVTLETCSSLNYLAILYPKNRGAKFGDDTINWKFELI